MTDATQSKTSPAAELVARCFALRTSAHMAHLKTRSYSEHMALQGLYEDIVDVTDEFAECHQGAFGLLGTFPEVCPCADPMLDQIDGLKDWLVENRQPCTKGDTALGNLIDNITSVLDRAAYKLRFLK